MKKIFFCLLTACMLLVFAPESKATGSLNLPQTESVVDSTIVKNIVRKLNEKFPKQSIADQKPSQKDIRKTAAEFLRLFFIGLTITLLLILAILIVVMMLV